MKPSLEPSLEEIQSTIHKMTILIQRNKEYFNRGNNYDTLQSANNYGVKTVEQKTKQLKRIICFQTDIQIKEECRLLTDILDNKDAYETKITAEMQTLSKQKSMLPWKSNEILNEKIQLLHWAKYDIFSNIVDITFQKTIYDDILERIDMF